MRAFYRNILEPSERDAVTLDRHMFALLQGNKRGVPDLLPAPLSKDRVPPETVRSEKGTHTLRSAGDTLDLSERKEKEKYKPR